MKYKDLYSILLIVNGICAILNALWIKDGFILTVNILSMMLCLTAIKMEVGE